MTQIPTAEKAFFFPPFHPNCRCTVVAVGKDGEDLPEGVENYATESSSTWYDVDDGFQIIPRRNVTHLEQIDSQDTAEIYFDHQHGIHVDFGSVKPTDWKAFAADYDKALSDVYDLVGKENLSSLESISIAETEEHLKYAVGWTTESGRKIVLNQAYVEDKQLSKAIQSNIENGVYSELASTAKRQYVLAHELGHVAYANLSEKQRNSLAVLFNSSLNADHPISRVATQSPNEFFAEYVGLFANPDNRLWLAVSAEAPAKVFEKIMMILGE